MASITRNVRLKNRRGRTRHEEIYEGVESKHADQGVFQSKGRKRGYGSVIDGISYNSCALCVQGINLRLSLFSLITCPFFFIVLLVKSFSAFSNFRSGIHQVFFLGACSTFPKTANDSGWLPLRVARRRSTETRPRKCADIVMREGKNKTPGQSACRD
jgi:hypothetical protein